MATRAAWIEWTESDAGEPNGVAPVPALIILDQLVRNCSPALARHHRRVGRSSERLARRLGLDGDAGRAIRDAGRLHDIGMTLVPPELIERPGSLDRTERELVRRHSHWGHELLSLTGDPALKVAAQVALEHHERWDGSGYPRGLKGTEISLAARIVAVCAVYDALRHPSARRKPVDHGGALSILREAGEGGGLLFDPEVVECFARLDEAGSRQVGLEK